MKKINIGDCGTTYTVFANQNIKYRIIFYDTFLAKIGLFDENHFPDYKDYLLETVECLTGFVANRHDLTWYARKRSESDIVDAVRLAKQQGNTTIIIEYLPETE